MTEVQLGYKLDDFLFSADSSRTDTKVITNKNGSEKLITNKNGSEKLIEITKEHSGSDERFQNTLDQYRKAYLDNINITLGIVGLGILIFYHYK